MAAYRADIEIGVKGVRQLEQLRSSINLTATAVDSLNEVIGGRGGLVQSIQNYANNVARASRTLKNVGFGDPAEIKAIREQVRAIDELNAATARQQALIARVRAESRQVTATSNAGYGQQTPALPPAMVRAREISQNWSAFFREAAEIGNDLRSTAAAKGLNIRTSWNGFFSDAAELALDIKTTTAAKSLNLKNNWTQFFNEATEVANDIKTTTAAKSLNLKNNWNLFFKEADQLALDLRAQALGASGRARIRQAENLAAYQAGQPRETFGYGGRQLALRPAGFTDQDVRIKNLLDDQNKAAQISNNLKIKLDKIATEAEIRNIQRELDAEIDKIETVMRAQKKADAAALRDFDNRLAARTRSNATQRTAAITRPAGRSGRFGDIASNAIIGGAFPLLFGQGGGAATGGAIGGAVGGLFGGAGGFAGSLLGTLIGERVGRGQQIKELAADIGFTAQQTQQLGEAFKRAGADFEKFQASVSGIQGLGLSIEDQARAIQLASGLTEAYGGKIDKITNAFAAALQSGKVTQATLNQLTSQGIPIQEALAQKYDVSRSKLLQMAKDGKISVQDLIDTLVKVGNTGLAEADKTPNAFKDGFEEIKQALGQLVNTFRTSFDDTSRIIAESTGRGVSAALGYIRDFIRGVEVLAQTVGPLLDSVTSSYLRIQVAIGNAIGSVPSLTSAVLQFVASVTPGLSFVAGTLDAINKLGANRAERQGPYVPPRLQRAPLQTITAPAQLPPSGAGASGKKGPEDRTAQLKAELEAIRAIGAFDNQIRDALFEGKELTAAGYELNKKLADIKRDQLKALEAANYASEKDLINQIAATRQQIARLEYADKRRAIEQKLFEESVRNKEVIQQTVQPLIDFRREQELQLKYAQNYYRLLQEGMLPAEAKRLIEFEKLVEQQLYAVEQQITLTESAILEARARGASTVELDKQLKLLKDQQKAIKDGAAKGPGEGKTDAQRIEEALGMAREEFANLTDPINQVIAGAKAIGDAFQQAFMGLVSGAMTGQQALASFFKGVGDHFMDMAAQMIAKLIEIWILQTVLGFISGAAGSGGGGTPNYSGAFSGSGPSFNPGAFTMPKLAANGAYWPGGFQAFADGGLVTRPTMGLVGEGGEPEYIIPQSKMRGAMQRYAAGARGSAVIPSGRDAGGGDVAPVAATAGAIDVRYTVERINSVDYVTADQFQRGMAQAAQQGAAQGERRALAQLRQNTSARRSVGI